MPLGEFFRIFGNLESENNRGNDDLAELVYENGQVAVKSHSGRVSRACFAGSETPKFCGDAIGHVPHANHGKSIEAKSTSDDISLEVPSGELDEICPVLSYPFVDEQVACDGSQILPANLSIGLTPQNSFFPAAASNDCFNQFVNSFQHSIDINELKASSSSCEPRPLCTESVQNRQTSISGFSHMNDKQMNIVSGYEGQSSTILNDSGNVNTETKPKGALLNFSYFSKLRGANLRNPADFESSEVEIKGKGLASGGNSEEWNRNLDTVSCCNSVKVFGSVSSSMEEGKRKDSAAGSSNSEFCVSSIPDALAGSGRQIPDNSEMDRNSKKQVLLKNENLQTVCSSSADTVNGVPDGIFLDVASRDRTSKCKRKYRDAEESKSRDDDTELSDVKRVRPLRRGGTGSKRSRAAEVHNESERRRRERINEKMKALQDLIPNSNHVDKAAMLDEAIDYLKILQRKVQILSMDAGLWIPPKITPPPPYLSPYLLSHFPFGMGFGRGAPPPPPQHLMPHLSGPSHGVFGLPVYGQQPVITRDSEANAMVHVEGASSMWHPPHQVMTEALNRSSGAAEESEPETEP